MSIDSLDNNIVERLFSSFSALEDAIDGAKISLSKNADVPVEILERLNSYDGILEKQRRLTRQLDECVRNGDVFEVSRHVNLINALSAMIVDDAKDVLAVISGSRDEDQDTVKVC